MKKGKNESKVTSSDSFIFYLTFLGIFVTNVSIIKGNVKKSVLKKKVF